jgi:hypothetical protein
MAKASDAFSTLKVLAPIFLISLVLFGYAIFNGTGGGRSRSLDYKNAYTNNRVVYDNNADEAPTKMPLSQWKMLIADNIKGHCLREGMTPAEVEQAVGEPTNARTVTYKGGVNGDIWEYTKREVVVKPCSKYEGDKCVDPIEYETKTATLYFSPKGHLTYPYLSGPLKRDFGERGSYCY